MERWEAAWQDKNLARVGRLALDFVILHPNKPLICGRDKTSLVFRPAELKRAGEWGEFHDLDRLR
jgi:hypothetical protein